MLYKRQFIEKASKEKAMRQLPMLPDIGEVIEFASNGWKLGKTHGLPHWKRVERNGILLSMQNNCRRDDINIRVVRYFAYLHDKCRLNNGRDLGHGSRAADMIPTIRTTILRELTDEEIILLERACRYHTTERRQRNREHIMQITSICWMAKTEHCRSVKEMQVANIKLLASNQK